MTKIAFLFLTVKNIHFPDIWTKYFNNIPLHKYSIYIHPKYSDTITWHRENIINDIQNTAWGFITHAYLSLFKEAVKDENNKYFVTISESCLPIKSFNCYYNHITKLNNSLISLMKITKYDKYERIFKHYKDLKHKNVDIIYPKYVFKHSAIFTLTRNDVLRLIDLEDNINFYHTMLLGEEYFLSVLYDTNISFNFYNFATTQFNWNYTFKIIKQIKNKIYNETQQNKIKLLQNELSEISKHPKTINIVDKEDIYILNTSLSFFYRKFSPTSDIEKYINRYLNKYININFDKYYI